MSRKKHKGNNKIENRLVGPIGLKKEILDDCCNSRVCPFSWEEIKEYCTELDLGTFGDELSCRICLEENIKWVPYKEFWQIYARRHNIHLGEVECEILNNLFKGEVNQG